MALLSFVRKLISKKQRIGLVLSSGGAKGFAHIGVLKVLEEAKIPIHCVVGTSAGAIIGGLYTSGMPIREIEELAAGLTIRDMVRLFMPSLDRGGFIDGDRVAKFLKPFIKDKNIENLLPEFACVATDIMSGRRVVFRKGNLLKAIRASIAIPGVYTPLIFKDYVLVDGAVVAPLPIDIAFSMGATFAIAVNVTLPQKKRSSLAGGDIELKFDKHHEKGGGREGIRNPIKKIFNLHEDSDDRKESIPPTMEVISSALTILETKLLELQLKTAGPHILVQPELPDIEVHSFRKGREIIEAGRKAMMEALPGLVLRNVCQGLRSLKK